MPDVQSTCPNQHPVEADQAFCPTCGAAVARIDAAADPGAATVNANRRPVLIAGAAVATVVIAAVIFGLLRSGAATQTITVELVRQGTGSANTCSAGGPTDQRFAGTNITVKGQDGTQLGAASVSSGADYSEAEQTCTWSGSVEVDETDAYTIALKTPSGDEQDFTLTSEELASSGWTLSLNVQR